MFDDVTGEPTPIEAAADREILAALWRRREAGDASTQRLWAALRKRHPDEPRLIALSLCAAATEDDSISAAAAIALLTELVGAAERSLMGLVADLVDVVRDELHDRLAGTDQQELNEIARRAGAGRGTREGALDRLHRFGSDFLRQAHDRTTGGRALEPVPRASANEPLKQVLEDTPTRAYSARGQFEHGDRIEHKKFGTGMVTRKMVGKMEVLFDDGLKTLVCGDS